MHLIKTEMMSRTSQASELTGAVSRLDALNGWLTRAARWWRQREIASLRRKAKRQMFLVESLVVGPKQRVVLLRCGSERFLVGTGAEGILSIVPVAPVRQSISPALRSPGEKQCG